MDWNGSGKGSVRCGGGHQNRLLADADFRLMADADLDADGVRLIPDRQEEMRWSFPIFSAQYTSSHFQDAPNDSA